MNAIRSLIQLKRSEPGNKFRFEEQNAAPNWFPEGKEWFFI
jgi:hypothetical protein